MKGIEKVRNENWRIPPPTATNSTCRKHIDKTTHDKQVIPFMKKEG